jgi:catechol 2,3-dioxygenase-like lactoylglutathione lyase family enzyme
VEQIDHVELTVPDRHAAAAWYHDVLGLSIVPELEFWADDPNGPLMISTEKGGTKLALFAGQTQGSKRTIGFHRVAFRASSGSFAEFVARLPELGLRNQNGDVLSLEMIVDHDIAFSIYFCDPYGHQLELTTYEYEQAANAIRRMRTEQSS